jgi:hypothetical protein
MIKITELDVHRFFKKVRKTDTCWIWEGAKTKNGYGVFSLYGVQKGAHRVSFAMANPDVDVLTMRRDPLKATYVLHSCDNPSCVNPAHLRLGSAGDNSADAKARNRIPLVIQTDLTRETILEIREKATDWDGMCDMMKKHKISQSTVLEVVNRRTGLWVDLPDGTYTLHQKPKRKKERGPRYPLPRLIREAQAKKEN